MSEEEQAKQALIRLAQRKAKSSGLEDKARDEAVTSLKDLGVSQDAMKYGAGAASLADMIAKDRIRINTDLSDDSELGAEISPRRKALKLLYNKSF